MWFAPMAMLQGDVGVRVETTLRQMSFAEKCKLLGGHDSMFVGPLSRLGLPEIKLSDGPAGVRCWGKATAYPSPVTLAASWSRDLASAYGAQIGNDCRARGVHVWLGPGVNLARVPQNGRNFEYFGEDPYLCSTLVVPVIKGVQAKSVAATIKHFVANDHEVDRGNDNSIVSESVLRQIYLRPFEAAIRVAGVKCLMSGYNLVNGVHMSQNELLVNKVARGEWGFNGVHMSDWGGTHETLGAVKNGLDWEMPDAVNMSPDKLGALMAEGKISEADIDVKVRNTLRLIYEMEWDKNPQLDQSIPMNDPRGAKLALEIAREGVVLLQNDGVLPFEKKAQKLLVIGPNASKKLLSGGGSAYTNPFQTLSLSDAVKAVSPSAHVDTVPISEDFDAAIKLPPFKGEYFKNLDVSGAPALTREDAEVNFNWNTEPPPGFPHDNYSVRWTTRYTPPRTEKFVLMTSADDGIRVFIDGKLTLNDWSDHGVQIATAGIELEGGKPVEIRVEFYQKAGDSIARFGLIPVFRINPEVKRAIEEADRVILSIGFDQSTEGEGNDRPFELPYDQIASIDRVLALNRNTVLVVNSGAGVDLSRWAKSARAILQGWYPGEIGNKAIAEVLFGDVNPSGHLPTTFPLTLKGTYYEYAYPSFEKTMAYREGLEMGYRWYGLHNEKPLFPFGHGLSYTKFSLDGARTVGDHIEAKVKNVGSRDGKTVVQVYSTVAKGEGVFRQLVGFAKVDLRAGESQTVNVDLDSQAFMEWDSVAHGWRLTSGDKKLEVGFSSGEISQVLDPHIR